MEPAHFVLDVLIVLLAAVVGAGLFERLRLPAGAGLLLAGTRLTAIVAGDAAVTAEHVLAGRVWSGCGDAEAAIRALTEIIELADVIVCGHDNYMLSPTRWMA